ncbi:MAG: TRAP transporter small permease [Gammaproteobacteria bacterium]
MARPVARTSTGVQRAYAGVLRALFGLSGLLLAATALLIVVDVCLRNAGIQPPAHTLTLTEYALLYTTMLGAPWLVRTRGHVYIELITAAVAPRVRIVMSGVVAAACVLVSLVLTWYSADVTFSEFVRGTADIRSFDMPRWMLLACMPVGFGLMAVEFARFLFGPECMHTGEAGIHE